MSLYLDDNTQSLTVDAGYVSTVLIMPQNERYAITEDGAIIDEGNWVESDGEPVVAGDTIVVDGAVNIASDITVTSESFTIHGAQTAIDTITVNDQALDFTTGSIAGAEGSTGLTLTLGGFANEAEAFTSESSSMSIETFDYPDGTTDITGTTLYFGSFVIQSERLATTDSVRVAWGSKYNGEWSVDIYPASSYGGNAGIIIRGSDVDNHLSFHLRSSDGLIRGEKRVNGNSTTVFSWSVSGYTSTQARNLKVVANEDGIRIYLDDVLQGSWTDDSGLTGTDAGIRSDSTPYTFDNFNYPASEISPAFAIDLDSIELCAVDTPTSEIKTLPVTIDVAETTALDVLVSVDDGSTFTTFATAPSAGEVTNNVTLPIGEHSLVFKLSDDSYVSDSYSVIVSRFVILGMGQSNLVGWWLDGTYPALVPSASGHKAWLFGNDYVKKEMVAKWDDGTNQVDLVSFDQANQAGDSWMIRFVNLMLATYDEPIICIPACRGGRTVAEFQKDNTTLVEDGLNLYASAVKRANEIGGVTINFYQQGENDCEDGVLTTASGYKTGLNQIVNDIKTDLGVDTLIIPLHTMTRSDFAGGNGTTTGQDAIRNAQVEVASENPNAYIAPPNTAIDVSVDGLHFLSDQSLSEVAAIAKTGYESYLASALNQPPTANAGADQSVEAGATFTLDGSASIDTDGTIAEYRWTQTQGDTVTLDLTDPIRPVGVAPSKSTAQTLTFSLITVDDQDAESVADTVDINVAAEIIESTLTVNIDGIPNGIYDTRIIDVDNVLLPFLGSQEWVDGSTSVTLVGTPAGTNCEVFALTPGDLPAGGVRGVTE